MSLGSRSLNRRQVVTFLMLFGACLAFTGCGSDKNARKPSADQAQVSGSVLNNGKPVAVDTRVVFESSEKSAVATGKVDALGKFSLRAGDASVGIPSGRYVVSITPPNAAPEKADVGSEAYKAKMMQGANMTAAKKPSDIPDKYQSAATSDLQLEVKAGSNTFDIDFAKLSP